MGKPLSSADVGHDVRPPDARGTSSSRTAPPPGGGAAPYDGVRLLRQAGESAAALADVLAAQTRRMEAQIVVGTSEDAKLYARDRVIRSLSDVTGAARALADALGPTTSDKLPRSCTA